MILVASRCIALVLASVVLATAAQPAEARSHSAHQHTARHHHHRAADRTAANDGALKGTSDDLDKTLNDRIRSICRGC
jgi:hypothetical protein